MYSTRKPQRTCNQLNVDSLGVGHHNSHKLTVCHMARLWNEMGGVWNKEMGKRNEDAEFIDYMS